MATYYVSAAGSNTAPYDTWAKAANLFGTAVTSTFFDGDIILVDKDHTEEETGTLTWSFFSTVYVVCVDKDASDAIASMGATGWIGSSTNSVQINMLGSGENLFFHGITFRTGGTTAADMDLGDDNAHWEFEDCYFWLGTTNTASDLRLGDDPDTELYLKFTNCTFRFGSASQNIEVAAACEFFGGDISSAGSAPGVLFVVNATDPSQVVVHLEGMDLSVVTGTFVANPANATPRFVLVNCKLGSGLTILGATQTNKSDATVFMFDCDAGDVHTSIGYYDAFGSMVREGTIKFTSGAADLSWKIVTTSWCSFYFPFVTPWVDLFHNGTSAITPYFEILRDGSATAYQDDEVWAEFAAKVTASSVQTSLSNDRMTLFGTPANQAAGAGLGSWSGESGSAWSGKIDAGGSLTPAEVGHIRGRVYVGEPSITVYVDPQIRT